MKVDYENGELRACVHPLAILDQLPPDKRRALAEDLACNDEVIEFVAQQIVDGCTESGYHGPSMLGAVANTEYAYALDMARRSIAKASGEIAKREIERLESALERSERECGSLRGEMIEIRDAARERRW